MADAPPQPEPSRLCLNMIVRNEMANLPRCLDAIAPHIACWVIGDTGSSDGTQDYIRAYFAARSIPGELHAFPFVNFEQARNAALDHAYASPLPYDYLLLADADMELVVDDPTFRARLDAPGYQILQKAGSGLVYWNTRLVCREIGARYHGVTHEYLDVPGGTQRLAGVWYKDHATGSNRTDKFDRDARLLSAALEQDPANHRSWFYLAQSYRDGGKTKEAAEAYAKRATMGGWDEEAWNARLQEARCLRTLGDDAGFLRAALQAFNQRPSRAEPLYDLARYYRERGMNDTSVLFSEPGLAIPRPDQDVLFIEDSVYTTGLREEYSIAANYSRDPARKDRGHTACDWLALSRDAPAGTRNLAKSNLFFYAEPLSAMAPSFTAKRIAFDPPKGWRALNPSIARWGDRLVAVLRTVNYELRDDGHYVTFDGSPITTRNYLLRLNDALEIELSAEILPPDDWPPPQYDLVCGFEDPRLFVWHDALWCTATVRDQTPEGWCEQVLARIDCPPIGPCRLTDWRMLRPEGERLHEKNWMPLVDGDALRFIYLCDPTRVLDDTARTVTQTVPSIAADEFKGGSQAIPFDGGWLALIHEVIEHGGKRRYQHRFVWFDAEKVLRKVSRRFYFAQNGVEFAAGLAWHPDGRRVLISYGTNDSDAWIATIQSGDIQRILYETRSNALCFQTSSRFDPPAQTAHIAETVRNSRSVASPHGVGSPVLYAMVSVKKSLSYTRAAIESFLSNTRFALGDRFILMANDHSPAELTVPQCVEWIVNARPQGFAQNVNAAIRMAKELQCGLVFLNNDMIFTPDWNLPLMKGDKAITIPLCNQNIQYKKDNLHLAFTMDWDDFSGRYEELDWIASYHRSVYGQASYPPERLMSFYCFHLPYPIICDVGMFDEGFGLGGGEDVDYRVRTLLAGYDVEFAPESYVLHFMGKSTWRSDEQRVETLERDRKYRQHFVGKWGSALAAVLLSGSQAASAIERYGLTDLMKSHDFIGIIKRCISDDAPIQAKRHLDSSSCCHEDQSIDQKAAGGGTIDTAPRSSANVARATRDERREPRPSSGAQSSHGRTQGQPLATQIGSSMSNLKKSPSSPLDDERTKKIGLCMIVRNEARLILRCLESVRPLVDFVLIEDTGSTDGTQQIVRDYLTRHALPGVVFDEPWRDFAHNRSIALARLRREQDIDYSLIMDADDILVFNEEFEIEHFKKSLSADRYDVEMRRPSIKFYRPQLLSNRKSFRYRGVLHEFIEGPPGENSSGTVIGFHILDRTEGARSQDPDKYRNDAKILEDALGAETDPFLRSRYTFYLAKSYQDCGEKEKALVKFLERTKQGFWEQEIYWSFYSAAALQADLGHPIDEALSNYSRATGTCPERAEALHGGSRLCRLNNRFAEGYELAQRGLAIPQPDGALFMEAWIYEYGLLDEFAVNAYWIGRYDDCQTACRRLLREGKIPAQMRDRVEKNAEFARNNMTVRTQAAAKPPRSNWTPEAPAAGTELMVNGLARRLGTEQRSINLRINGFTPRDLDERPLVVWFHHDVNQAWVQWCHDRDLVEKVSCYVFVSDWQRERYIRTFGLPPGRCVVMRNATDVPKAVRTWVPGPPWRCAYTSTPFRGLNVLLKAWGRLQPADAELHIWSSMKLYGQAHLDQNYQHLYELADCLPGVIYHGVVPNTELRASLASMHFLTYPNTFEETACLAVIEAMSAGCRIIAPYFGALPETLAGYGRLYPREPDEDAHAASFARVLASEIATPWDGDPELATAQQRHCAAVFDWPRREHEWRRLIADVCNGGI